MRFNVILIRDKLFFYSALICGGQAYANNSTTFSTFYSDIFIFDYSTNEYTLLDFTLPSARAGHQMALVNSSIVIFGGYNVTNGVTTFLNDLILISLDSNNNPASMNYIGTAQSGQVPPATAFAASAAFVSSYDGLAKFTILGGRTGVILITSVCYVLDLNTMTWYVQESELMRK